MMPNVLGILHRPLLLPIFIKKILPNIPLYHPTILGLPSPPFFCHPRYPLNMSRSFPKLKWDILFRSQRHLDMTMESIPLEET